MAALNINPNARERAPGFPPQFASAPVPTALGLYNRIPPAIQFNLYRVITEGIRHEENAYGYFNSAFVSIFLPTQQFQVSDLGKSFVCPSLKLISCHRSTPNILPVLRSKWV